MRNSVMGCSPGRRQELSACQRAVSLFEPEKPEQVTGEVAVHVGEDGHDGKEADRTKDPILGAVAGQEGEDLALVAEDEDKEN